LDSLDEYIRIHNDIYNNILLGCFSSVKYKGLFFRNISSSQAIPPSAKQGPASPVGRERISIQVISDQISVLPPKESRKVATQNKIF
jgi:hypothetical protein